MCKHAKLLSCSSLFLAMDSLFFKDSGPASRRRLGATPPCRRIWVMRLAVAKVATIKGKAQLQKERCWKMLLFKASEAALLAVSGLGDAGKLKASFVCRQIKQHAQGRHVQH